MSTYSPHQHRPMGGAGLQGQAQRCTEESSQRQGPPTCVRGATLLLSQDPTPQTSQPRNVHWQGSP